MKATPVPGMVIKGIVLNEVFIDKAISELRKYEPAKAESLQALKEKIQDEDGNVFLMETLLNDLNEVAGEDLYFGLNFDFDETGKMGYGFWSKDEKHVSIN
jgi:hypothetical protein